MPTIVEIKGEFKTKIGMIERESGTLHLEVTMDVKKDTMKPIVERHIYYQRNPKSEPDNGKKEAKAP